MFVDIENNVPNLAPTAVGVAAFALPYTLFSQMHRQSVHLPRTAVGITINNTIKSKI